MVGLLLAGGLAGCATSNTFNEGLPNANNPEYLAHPFRVLTLPLFLVGNLLQYGLVEPTYFLVNQTPEAFGLSQEEQRYIAMRQEEWRKYLEGERKLVE
jgi:hypothetical protein